MLPKYLQKIREEIILELSEREDITLADIGLIFGITRQGVFNLKKRAQERRKKEVLDK